MKKFSPSLFLLFSFLFSIQIAWSQNVGIGTATPGQKLDVSGAVRSDNGFTTADGTPGEPAYRFDNNANMGMYRAGSNDLRFSVGGSWRFRIATSYVQTSSPIRAANGSVTLPSYTFSSTGNTNTGMYLPANSMLAFTTNGVERVRIDDNGNVGIGVATPGYAVDVAGSINLTGAIRISGAAGTSGQVLTSSGGGAMTWTTPTTGTVTSIATGTGLTGGPISGTGTISMANMPANTIKGNNTAASAAPVDIAVGTNTVLGRQGGNIVAAQVATDQIANNAVTNAKIRQGAALSVIGRASNSTGDVADIAAASDHQVLRRSGTTLGFGAINLASTSAVTGTLGIASGGTGLTSAGASGNILSSNGSAWTSNDGSTLFIRNQNAANQTGNFRISGTGRANTSFQSPVYTRADAGTVAIRPNANSTTAIQFQNATGGNILNVDATNSRVSIGTTTAASRLTVDGGTGQAIRGYTTNTNGYLGYQGSISLGTFGTLSGASVYASNPNAGYGSFAGLTSGSADYAAVIGYSSVWMAGYFGVDNSSSSFNPTGLYGQLNVTNSSLAGIQRGTWGTSIRTATSGNPGISVGVLGTAQGNTQDAIGVMGIGYSNSGFVFGGMFDSYNNAGTTGYGYAYVGGLFSSTSRKIIGSGSVSEIIPTKNHGRITLTAPESPEYWYIDYGTAYLKDGYAKIELDPILADIIVVDKDNPLKVFIQVNIPVSEGIAVINKTATGFELIERNGGKNSGEVDYQIVAKPKTNYGEGRFPQAPGPAGWKPELDPPAARTKNQPNPDKIFRWPSDYEVYNYSPAPIQELRKGANPKMGEN